MSYKYYIKHSFSDLDDLVYTILGISTVPLAPAPTLAKPAKITPAIRCTAACKAKQRKSAKACVTRSKRTASSNAGRYTTNSGLIANKDDNNIYNRAYIPPTNAEEKKGSSSNNDSVNSGTSDSANKGKDSSVYKHSKGTLRYEDMLLHKQQRVISYPYSPPSTPYTDIYVYYV
ncbi:hypothetical protein P8C59_007612 [Phyllachora maydis]|uniref:Uncharacterized protein n=1 Tax=Phyllachora maydis TaxID=1825666 RepID=A0AAD9MH50_9PEZI|nr:hypothetical protein P8C59_007612 [Phyllachora maydis]